MLLCFLSLNFVYFLETAFAYKDDMSLTKLGHYKSSILIEHKDISGLKYIFNKIIVQKSWHLLNNIQYSLNCPIPLQLHTQIPPTGYVGLIQDTEKKKNLLLGSMN